MIQWRSYIDDLDISEDHYPICHVCVAEKSPVKKIVLHLYFLLFRFASLVLYVFYLYVFH